MVPVLTHVHPKITLLFHFFWLSGFAIYTKTQVLVWHFLSKLTKNFSAGQPCHKKQKNNSNIVINRHLKVWGLLGFFHLVLFITIVPDVNSSNSMDIIYGHICKNEHTTVKVLLEISSWLIDLSPYCEYFTRGLITQTKIDKTNSGEDLTVFSNHILDFTFVKKSFKWSIKCV